MMVTRLLFFCTIFSFGSIQILAQNQLASGLRELDSLAFSAYENNKSDEAERLANRIINQHDRKKPDLYLINAYTLLGIINKNRGYYITSLEMYVHALNASEKIGDKGRVSACLNNIGIIYKLQNNLQQSINYFNRSLKIEEQIDNPLQKSIRYFNLGDCHKDLKNYDEALAFFNSSLLIEKKFKNTDGIIYAQLGIAEVYLGIGRKSDAGMVLSDVNRLLKSDMAEENIIYNKLLGWYNLKNGQIEQALQALHQAENRSIAHRISSHLKEIYLLQIEAEESLKDWIEANKIYKKFIRLNEELSNSEIKNKIEDITYQNELQKKELEIKLVVEERNLAKKNEQYEKDLRLYIQKITWFIVFVLIMAVGLVYYGIRKLTRTK